MARYGGEFGGGRHFRGNPGRRYEEDYMAGQGFDRSLYSPRIHPGGMRYGSEYADWGRQGGYPIGRAGGGGYQGSPRYDRSFRRTSGMEGGYGGDFDRSRGRGGREAMARDQPAWGGEYVSMPERGRSREHDRGYGAAGDRFDRGFTGGRRGEAGSGYDRSVGRRGFDSYGPRFGERWESTQPEDIARRNFDR